MFLFGSTATLLLFVTVFNAIWKNTYKYLENSFNLSIIFFFLYFPTHYPNINKSFPYM